MRCLQSGQVTATSQAAECESALSAMMLIMNECTALAPVTENVERSIKK